MGNKQSTSSCGVFKNKHRPDTRAKNWSFHAMDGQRYPGMATRSKVKNNEDIKGRSSFLHEAMCPSHCEISYTRMKFLKDKKNSVQREMSLTMKNLSREMKCLKLQEKSSATNNFLPKNKCPALQKMSCRDSNVVSKDNSSSQSELTCEKGNNIHKNTRSQLEHTLPEYSGTNNSDRHFHENIGCCSCLEEHAVENTLSLRAGNRNDEDIRDEINGARLLRNCDQNSVSSEQNCNEECSDLTQPSSTKKKHCSLSEELDLRNWQFGNNQISEDNMAKDDLFMQTEECYSLEENIANEYLWVGLSGKYHRFDDCSTKDDFDFGQSGKYRRFSNNTIDDLGFDEDFKNNSFTGSTNKDFRFGNFRNRLSWRCDVVNDNVVDTHDSRRISDVFNDWSVVESANCLIYNDVPSSSRKCRSSKSNFEVNQESKNNLKSERGTYVNINNVCKSNDDCSYRGDDEGNSDLLFHESQICPVNTEDTSRVVESQIKQNCVIFPPDVKSKLSSPLSCNNPSSSSPSSCGYLTARGSNHNPSPVTGKDGQIDNVKKRTRQREGITESIARRRRKFSVTGNTMDDMTGNATDDMTGNATDDMTGNATDNVTGDSMAFRTNGTRDLSPILFSQRELSLIQFPQKELSPIPFLNREFSPIPFSKNELFSSSLPCKELSPISDPHEGFSPIEGLYFTDLSSTPKSSSLSLPSPSYTGSRITCVSPQYDNLLATTQSQATQAFGVLAGHSSGSQIIKTVAFKRISSFDDSCHLMRKGSSFSGSLPTVHRQQDNEANVDVTSLSADHGQSAYINIFSSVINDHKQQEGNHQIVNISPSVQKDHVQLEADRLFDSSKIDIDSSLSKKEGQFDIVQRTENIDRRSLHRLRLDFENNPGKGIAKTGNHSKLASPQELIICHKLNQNPGNLDCKDGKHRDLLKFSKCFRQLKDSSRKFSDRLDNINKGLEIDSPTIVVNTAEDFTHGRNNAHLSSKTSQLTEHYGSKLSCAVPGTPNFDCKVSMTTSSSATTPTASDSGYGTGTSFTSFDQSGRAYGVFHDVSPGDNFSREDNYFNCESINGEPGGKSLLATAIISGEFVNIFQENQWWENSGEKEGSGETVEKIEGILSSHRWKGENCGENSGILSRKTEMNVNMVTISGVQSVDISLNESDSLNETKSDVKEHVDLIPGCLKKREQIGEEFMQPANNEGEKERNLGDNRVENIEKHIGDNEVGNCLRIQDVNVEKMLRNRLQNRGQIIFEYEAVNQVENKREKQMVKQVENKIEKQIENRVQIRLEKRQENQVKNTVDAEVGSHVELKNQVDENCKVVNVDEMLENEVEDKVEIEMKNVMNHYMENRIGKSRKYCCLQNTVDLVQTEEVRVYQRTAPINLDIMKTADINRTVTKENLKTSAGDAAISKSRSLITTNDMRNDAKKDTRDDVKNNTGNDANNHTKYDAENDARPIIDRSTFARPTSNEPNFVEECTCVSGNECFVGLCSEEVKGTSYVLSGNDDSGICDLSIHASSDREPFQESDETIEMSISESSQNLTIISCVNRKKISTETLKLPSVIKQNKITCDVSKTLDSASQSNHFLSQETRANKILESSRTNFESIDVSQPFSSFDEDNGIRAISLQELIKENRKSIGRATILELTTHDLNIIKETSLINQEDNGAVSTFKKVPESRYKNSLTRNVNVPSWSTSLGPAPKMQRSLSLSAISRLKTNFSSSHFGPIESFNSVNYQSNGSMTLSSKVNKCSFSKDDTNSTIDKCSFSKDDTNSTIHKCSFSKESTNLLKFFSRNEHISSKCGTYSFNSFPSSETISKDDTISFNHSMSNECPSSKDDTNLSLQTDFASIMMSSLTQKSHSLVTVDSSHPMNVTKSLSEFPSHTSLGSTLVPTDIPKSSISPRKTKASMEIFTDVCYNSNDNEGRKASIDFELEVTQQIKNTERDVKPSNEIHVSNDAAEVSPNEGVYLHLSAKSTSIEQQVSSSETTYKSVCGEDISTEEVFCVKVPKKTTSVDQLVKFSENTNKSRCEEEISADEGFCVELQITPNLNTNCSSEISKEIGGAGDGLSVEIPTKLTCEEMREKTSGRIAMGIASACIRRSHVGQVKAKDKNSLLLDVAKPLKLSTSVSALHTSSANQNLVTENQPFYSKSLTTASYRNGLNIMGTENNKCVNPVKQINVVDCHREPKQSEVPVHYRNESLPKCVRYSQRIRTADSAKSVNHNFHPQTSVSSTKHHTSLEMLLEERQVCSDGKQGQQRQDLISDDLAYSWNIPRQRRSLDSEQFHHFESMRLSYRGFTENQPRMHLIAPNNAKLHNSTSCLSDNSEFNSSQVKTGSTSLSSLSDSLNTPKSTSSISLPPLAEDYHVQNVNSISNRFISPSSRSCHPKKAMKSINNDSNITTPNNEKLLKYQKQVNSLINRRINSDQNIHSNDEGNRFYGDFCLLESAGGFNQSDVKFGWYRSRDRKFQPVNESAKNISNLRRPLAGMSSIPDLASSRRRCSTQQRVSTTDRSSHYNWTSSSERNPHTRLLRHEQEHFPELPQTEVCPSCQILFDTGRRRKLIDSCGHQRCFSCLFSCDLCPVCTTQERNSPPPPPPDVAQHDLQKRLQLLLGQQKTSQ